MSTMRLLDDESFLLSAYVSEKWDSGVLCTLLESKSMHYTIAT